MMPAVIDLTGQKFGRLTAIRQDGRNKHGFVLWLWRCDCGKQISRAAHPIKVGRQVSCGCYQAEGARARAKHGMHATPTHKAWVKCRARCEGREPENARHYADRGITVCPEWSDFRVFLADMGERPPGMSLERIDNDKGYGPDNCRWATQHDQTRNTRRTVRVRFDGAEMCLKDACAAKGVPYARIRSRIRKGNPPQAALDRP